jgi:hypothetical protein
MRHEHDARGAVRWGADADSDYIAFDQPVNNRLFTKVWKIGYDIKENIWVYGASEDMKLLKP